MKEFFLNYWYLLLLLVVWDIVLKLMAMFRAARRNKKIWFVALGLLNTVGILPLIYLYISGKKQEMDM